jgi:putative ABC transport system permease protein
MFLALRELRFAKGRFTLVGLVIGLIATLMVLLSGLATGLVDDGIAGLRALPATHIAFDEDADTSFSSSVIDRETWQALAAAPGVEEAAPLGNTLFNARTGDDLPVNLALFGVEPQSFVAPSVTQGAPLGAAPDGVVIADALADQGIEIGDVIRLDVVGTSLTVIGIAPTGTYGHVPVVYAPLDLWQQASFGHTEDAADRTSAVALRLADEADVAALNAAHGTEIVTRSDSYHSSPGYTEEMRTMQMIQMSLYLISAVLVGAFFVVWTVQRRQEIGVLKAIGATDWLLLREALAQGAVIIGAAAGIGLLLGGLLGSVVGDQVPFRLSPAAVLSSVGLLVLFGLLGAAFAIRRITAVDPLIALRGAR